MSKKLTIKVKKFMISLTLLIVLGFSLSCSLEPIKPDPIQLGDYSYIIEYVTYHINKAMKEQNLPSIAVALIDDQEIVWQEAFGYADLDKKTPVLLDTVYRTGSISKIFTAIAIMKLFEDGIIDIDTPVSHYLPAFSIQSRFPYSDPITIRSILSHRSGLPNSSNRLGEAGLESSERVSLKGLIDSLKDQYVAYPVGYRYKYSNLGITLLGRIIEVVTGNEFADYMQKNILNPLGTNESSFLSSSEIEEKIATDYVIYQGKAKPQPQFDLSELPAVNLYSTLNDMCKFLMFLFREGKIGSNQFIKSETLKKMYFDSYSRPRDPTTAGLIWNLGGDPSSDHLTVWHGGWFSGFLTFISCLPYKKLGFIVLTNGDNQLTRGMMMTLKRILELMYETKFGIKPEEEYDIPNPVNLDKSILENYTGKYACEGPVYELSIKNDTLQIAQMGQSVDLIPVSENTFRFPIPLEILTGQINVFEFFTGDDTEEDIMIINNTNLNAYIVCPKIPMVEKIPALWDEVIGEYSSEIYISEGTNVGKAEIKIVDNVLTVKLIIDIPHFEIYFVLNPISETEMLILDGIFSGETIFYDDTGYLRLCGITFKPVQ